MKNSDFFRLKIRFLIVKAFLKEESYLNYLITLTIFSYCCLSLYSYFVLKNDDTTRGKHFKMAVTWGVILTLFVIFSGIFVLVALFSIITDEWDTRFLLTKLPVFFGTLTSALIFLKCKKRWKGITK